MIYLDTSVALARLFAEERAPTASLWQEALVASRLLEYELRTRVHADGLGASHGDDVRALLRIVDPLALTPAVLARALEPLPVPVGTLDALHLASAEFLRSRGQSLALASYDTHMTRAADALGIPLFVV